VSRPAPGAPFVAVLQRRGRFLTAERLFPAPAGGSGPPRRSGSSRLVVGSANSSRSSMAGAREGDLVLVRPAGKGSGARVQVRIGRPEVARDVIEALLHDRGLSRRFPASIEREAREAGERVMADAEGRRDLTGLATFTIDPVSARDFDDAISAEDAGSGRVRIWVHIADVAAHVPEGSAIDREARRRSTSVYVPGTVEPMLPHALSSDACSLVPGVRRAAVTVELLLDGETVQSAAFYRSLIRSDERLDYERVDRIFAGSEPTAAPWAEPLALARRVAAALQLKRERSGGLALDSPEPEFAFDEHGDVSEIHGRTQTESHRLIEHLMIAANEAVAGLLAQRAIPCLYRVHERPEPERVERLADQLISLEVPTPPIPERMSSTEAAELMAQMSVKVEEHLQRTGGDGRRGLSSLVLRTLKQAYYSPRNLGHAGLNSAAYCHFTSPIRRYPDIVCHRALLSAVGAGERQPRAAELVELGAWTSEREREAMVIERDGDDIAGCFALERMLFESGPDQALDGEITGLISAGAFIAFDGPEGRAAEDEEVPPFEGMLPVRLLRAPRRQGQTQRRSPREDQGRRGGERRPQERGESREWWELNEEGTILRGERTGATLRLGDSIPVRVVRVDTIRGRVDLEPAG
jgi:ribonuclease R